MNQEKPQISPNWGNNTKLVVALTLVTFLIALLISFRGMVMPLILAILLAYLLYPVIDKISKKTRFSWRLTVAVIYLLLFIIVIGLVTWGGIVLVEQFQSLLRFLQRTLQNLPEILEELSTQKIQIATFELDLANLELENVISQILSSVTPLLSRTGTLVGNLASSAAVTIGLTLFVLLISHFILAETKGNIFKIFNLDIPGYHQDFDRIGLELGRIWHAFLRGHLLIMALTFIIYLVFLNILGVNFSIGLALLASIARLLPYVGPAIAWTVYGLVALFQANTIFGLPPLIYTAGIIGVALLIDMFMDNYIVPKVYSDALRLHPAAILVGAIVAASWLGLVGALLAAPVIATLKLLVTYGLRKLFDLDPWENFEKERHGDPKTSNLLSGLESKLKNTKTWVSDKLQLILRK